VTKADLGSAVTCFVDKIPRHTYVENITSNKITYISYHTNAELYVCKQTPSQLIKNIY